MKIKIPRFIYRPWLRFSNWGNVPVFQLVQFEILRLDLLLIAMGLICTIYYGYLGGWKGALLGGLMFWFMAMCAMMLRPPD